MQVYVFWGAGMGANTLLVHPGTAASGGVSFGAAAT